MPVAAPERPLRIALVDDHAVVREGFQRLLEVSGEMRVVAEFGDVESLNAALANLPRLHLDLLVFDLSLRGGSGFDLLRRIATRHPKLRILVFTMFDSPELASQCLRAGAAGFVTKGSDPDAVIDAVWRCVQGEVPLSVDVAQALHSRAGIAPHANLSSRAFSVLLELVKGKTLEEIGDELHMSAKTVANYQTVIRRVLGVDNSVALVHYAQRHCIGTASIS